MSEADSKRSRSERRQNKSKKSGKSDASTKSSRAHTPTPTAVKEPAFGDDFISFDTESSTSRVRQEPGSSDATRERGRSPNHGSTGRDSRHEERERDSRVREWDRGKQVPDSPESRRNDKKRKHERISREEPPRKRQRSDLNSRIAPWLEEISYRKRRCNNVAELLHHEVNAFVNWISPTPVEDEIRGLVVQHISQAITSTFPDAKVLPFGSYGTKLYLPSGDIDLVVVSQSMAHSNRTNVLYAVANAMRRAGVTNTKVTVISKARVPIIKFVTTHGRFNVDISINQESGLLAGSIINSFLKDMKGCGLALRSLIMVTKAFLSQRSMNEVFTGGLGSYSIVCMAISFLQMHPKIRRGEIDPEKNLGVLLMEFFELYGCNFNFVNVGISLREGGTYFSKTQRWSDYSSTQLLSIEDPADPTNDISKGSYQFPKVRTTFAGAYGILLSTAYYRAGVMNAKRDGHYTRIHDEDRAEDISILASIIGIPQETINHRLLVEELYHSRTLHDITGISPRKRTMQTEYPESSSPLHPEEPGTSKSIIEVPESTDDEEDGEKGPDEKHAPQASGDHDEEDDEGRYGIGRVESKAQRITEFTGADSTTDDDHDLSSDEEEGQIVPVEDARESSQRREEKMAFWAAKGGL
jgi:non-canonical poly(A) RNA polymerase PAPD5/7